MKAPSSLQSPPATINAEFGGFVGVFSDPAGGHALMEWFGRNLGRDDGELCRTPRLWREETMCEDSDFMAAFQAGIGAEILAVAAPTGNVLPPILRTWLTHVLSHAHRPGVRLVGFLGTPEGGRSGNSPLRAELQTIARNAGIDHAFHVYSLPDVSNPGDLGHTGARASAQTSILRDILLFPVTPPDTPASLRACTEP